MSTAEMTTRTIAAWRDDLGIVHGTRQAPEETLDHARENIRSIQELSGGRRALVLFDSRAATTTLPAVRAFYASDEVADTIRALAILVDSPTSRLLGTIFLGFQNPRVYTKLFTDEASAAAWLTGFLTRRDDGAERTA